MSSYSLLNSFRFSPSMLQPPLVDVEFQSTSDLLPLGGFLYESKYIWLTKGAILQIICTKTQTKISEWMFGNILNDYSVQITHVVEIPRKRGSLPLLAIGLQSGAIGGYICIFDVASSKVIRSVDVKYNVSSLLFVETDNGLVPLPGPLRAFDGVLAVGLSGGDVLLIDLCWQILDEVLSGNADIKDELNPCDIVVLLNKDMPRVEHYKEKSIRKGFHLAIHLNYVDKDPSLHFKLKAPNGDTIVLVNNAEVTVSALHYCPQLGSLLIGYNFGALQLWNIINMELVYTSPVYEKNMPVSHFAVQEPSDDPKAFCYVWAVYSNTEPFIDDFPVAALYSFTYTTKEFHEGYGCLYEGFVSCRVKFQMDLMLPDDYIPARKPKGAWCVSLKAVNKNRNTALVELPEDNLVISCFVWTVWCSTKEIYTYQAIFDLNQWYKEQMPGEPQYNDCSSYLMYKRLTELNQNDNGVVLDTVLKRSTITQFMGVQRLEEHYYPSSLSFDFSVLRENDCSLITVRGVQKAFLQHLQTDGPLALIHPFKLYQEASHLGLIPLFTDVPSENSVNEIDQRKLILSVALEQQMLSWLCSCAREWANGSFSTVGCTIDLLLNWAWERAIILKTNADGLCVTLFDCSGIKLDANNQKIVNCCCRQLTDLNVFYTFILEKLQCFLYDKALVQTQCDKLHMVSTYFEVLQWLINVKLLPETPDMGDSFDNDCSCITYPVEIISNYFNKRRTDLLQLSEKRFREKLNLLFIDNLIDIHCGGINLKQQWQEEEGDGSYPPPSLQALLRSYLLENVDVSHKHSLVVYVFLDLAMVLNQDRYTETITQLIKFPAVFKLSQSIIKITQAFWQLDHEDFSTALEHLLDPLVLDSDLKLWHHRIVLKALLAQEQYNFGLLYLKTRNPPMVNEDDFKLAVSFYVANSMVDNAFNLLRRNGNSKPKDKLLMYFFGECVRFEKTREVLAYPLSTEEETSFFNYLETINHPHAYDVRVVFNIMKSRFLDAYELNTRAHLKKFTRSGSSIEGSAELRDFMVSTYKKLMPDVSQKLINVYQKERAVGLWREVPKPLPMSVFIHDAKEQVKYKSMLINASIAKARDTWTHPILQNDHDDIMKSEEMPFLRTPTIDLKDKKQITPVVIEPVNIGIDESEIDGPSPPKRAKLKGTYESSMVKLQTPIVKRKTPRVSSRMSIDRENVCTPHSILKVGNLVRKLDEIAPSRGESTTPEDLSEIAEDTEKPPKRESFTQKRFSFGLTPRRSLSRLDNHAVRFSGLTTLSSNTTISTPKKSKDTSKTDSSSNVTPQRTSNPTQEDASKTASPEESFHSVEEIPEYPDPKIAEMEKQLKELDEDESQQSVLENTEMKERYSGSPKSRRSLRSTNSPVRQSPRLSQRTSSGVSTPVPSSPQTTSTPFSTPTKSFLPSKRMSLKQQVLTNNALKALTPRKRISETSYSKIDTVTTKVQTPEGLNESVSTSVVEKSDVVVEEASMKTYEHNETTKTSVSNYSKSNIDFDKYISSPYKGIELNDSIFQSDASADISKEINVGMESENQNIHSAEKPEQIDVEMESEKDSEQVEIAQADVEKEQTEEMTENENDPTFNVYECLENKTPNGNQRESNVLTEMPIMSEEQYSAMEENDFDELHEEYFNEEIIVQQYLSQSENAADRPERNEEHEVMVSEVIEIDSSSSSEKANYDSENSSVVNSGDEPEKIQSTSESDSESESSEDDRGIRLDEDDDKMDSNVASEESSVASMASSHLETIFEEDTEERQFANENNEMLESAEQGEEYAHLPVEQEIEGIVIESCAISANERPQLTSNEEISVEVIEVKDTPPEETSTTKIVEVIKSKGSVKQNEEFSFVQKSTMEATEVSDTAEVSTARILEAIKNKGAVMEIEGTHDEFLFVQVDEVIEIASTPEESPLLPEEETSTAKVESKTSKSDLEFSVLSQNQSATLHKTDLNYSVETPNQTNISKSDLEFSLMSDQTSLCVFPSTSTPVLTSQTGYSTPNTRRKSKSVDLSKATPETRRASLRKRSLSVDLTEEAPEQSKSRKQSLTAKLPVILEQNAQNQSSILEARRVTRRQKKLLEKAETSAAFEAESSGSENEERGPALAPIDPLKLLDKPSFQGKPDPEEASVRKRSPSSFSRTSSKSETSITRKRSFTKAKTASPPPLTIRTRSRTKSVDFSPKTEPKKRTRSKQNLNDDNESVGSEISTRSRKTRAKSVSSLKSDVSATSSRRKRVPSKKSEVLTKIEEKVEETKPSRRITRSSSSKI